MKFTNALVLGASAMALAIGSAYAADTSTKKDEPVMGKAGQATRSDDSTFAKLDKNHDGQLSRREFDSIYRVKPRRRTAAAAR